MEIRLICKVALSPVSIENARLNMATEVPGWDFEYIARAAETSWEKELRKIIIQGTDLQKKIFYTALYHTMVQPNTMSDVNVNIWHLITSLVLWQKGGALFYFFFMGYFQGRPSTLYFDAHAPHSRFC